MVTTILFSEVQILVGVVISDSDLSFQSEIFKIMILRSYIKFMLNFDADSVVPTISVPEVQILVISVISDSNIQNHCFLIERITACMKIIYGTKMTDLKSKFTDDYVLSLGGIKWLVPPSPHQNLT